MERKRVTETMIIANIKNSFIVIIIIIRHFKYNLKIKNNSFNIKTYDK